jgi:hypothetical protein
MKFIPATDAQLFKLSCTTRRSSSRTSSGAKFLAQKDYVKNTKINFALAEVEDNVFINGRIVFVCK